MKRYFILIAVAVAVAAGSYALTRNLMPAGEEDQLAWLTREFQLTPAQTAAVEKLQADYQPVCAGHCQLIMAARTRLADSPGDAAVQTEITRLEQICSDATRRHLHEVSAQMAPEQARRFLALVEPKLSRQTHQGPLGLK
jgi:hypothetical protein